MQQRGAAEAATVQSAEDNSEEPQDYVFLAQHQQKQKTHSLLAGRSAQTDLYSDDGAAGGRCFKRFR